VREKAEMDKKNKGKSFIQKYCCNK